MKKLLLLTLVLLLTATCAMAVEKKPITEVDSDEFTTETQVSPKGAGDNHVAIVWWIPNEFWESILARDATTAEADKQAMLDAMSGISLLAVVQADITQIGAFEFYTKEEVAEQLTISFMDADGNQQTLTPLENLKPDLEVVLGIFKPILGAAMGNLGTNMHFYVLNDETDASARLLDPYEKGLISVQLTQRKGVQMTAKIETPLNSLFVPRKCPNGKDAHISWKYCPWSGEPLED